MMSRHSGALDYWTLRTGRQFAGIKNIAVAQ
jgi:hypothetical protein